MDIGVMMDTLTQCVLSDAEEKVVKVALLLGSLSDRSRDLVRDADMKSVKGVDSASDALSETICFLYEVEATLDVLSEYLEGVGGCIRGHRKKVEPLKAA